MVESNRDDTPMFKITGLDNLQRQLQDAQKALESLGGDLGTVNFDPNDPSSIESAVNEISRIIDEKVGTYANNPIIGPLAEEMKAKYRAAIVEKAAAARLQADEGRENGE